MTNSESVLVENLLARPEMHRQWARDYRTDDNERFYEQALIHRRSAEAWTGSNISRRRLRQLCALSSPGAARVQGSCG